MAATNISAISYVGEQASEFTIQPMVQAADISNLMQVHTDVMYRKQLALLRSGKYGWRTDTGKNKANTGGGSTGSEVWLEVNRIYAQDEQDVASYFEKFLIEQAKKGNDSGDLGGVSAAEQIVALYSADRALDLERLIWGGNEDAVIGNFTTTPDATAATKLAFYRTVTGQLTRMMAKIASGDIQQVALIGATPSATDVIGYFRAVYSGQSAELRATPKAEKYLACTSNIMDLFYTNRESFTGSDFSFQFQNEGPDRVFFRGIEIVNRDVWNIMQQEQSWGAYLPTSFLFLASRDAMAFGADAYSVNTTADTWYDKTDDVNYIRTKAAIGTQFVADYMIVAATSTPVA